MRFWGHIVNIGISCKTLVGLTPWALSIYLLCQTESKRRSQRMKGCVRELREKRCWPKGVWLSKEEIQYYQDRISKSFIFMCSTFLVMYVRNFKYMQVWNFIVNSSHGCSWMWGFWMIFLLYCYGFNPGNLVQVEYVKHHPLMLLASLERFSPSYLDLFCLLHISSFSISIVSAFLPWHNILLVSRVFHHRGP